MISSLLGVLMVLAATSGHNREESTLQIRNVNCDAGEDLAAVLRRINNNPNPAGTAINLRGICTGNFEITATPLSLRVIFPGDPKEYDAVLGATFALAIARDRNVAIHGGRQMLMAKVHGPRLVLLHFLANHVTVSG